MSLDDELAATLPKLRRFVSSKVDYAQDHDDIVQETMIRALNSSAKKSIQNPLAYVYAVSKTVMIDYWHKRRALPQVSLDDENSELETLPAKGSLEQTQIDLEKLENIQQMIENMPRLRREVFALRRLEGKSRQDIAKILGISEESVKKHITRAMADIAIQSQTVDS